jgi:integrase/recombinase XerD
MPAVGKFYNMMSNELKIRGYSDKTHETYLKCMKDFVRYHMKSPDELGIDDIKDYQIYPTEEKKVSCTVFSQCVCAIRFFYKNTLRKDWNIEHIPYQKKRKKLPDVLSVEEVTRLIDAVSNIKHKAIIQALYSTGMRSLSKQSNSRDYKLPHFKTWRAYLKM